MVFSLESIINAYYSCRKGKRNSFYQLSFEKSLEENLYNLSYDLTNRKYEVGTSSCFVITFPTIREIFAASFVDRVVHHLLINYIEAEIDRTFIYDSFACRKEHGVVRGSKRLSYYLNKITKNRKDRAYYLKLDIKSFFYSINKNILMNLLTKKINCLKYRKKDTENLLWLSSKVIFHDPCANYRAKGDITLIKTLPKDKSLFNTDKNIGLAIGNLTSQFFANLYLNKLDQYIKRDLKVKYYIRYADDMVFLSNNIPELKETEEKVRNFLKRELSLEIKKNKTKYGSVYQGIDFLGYIVKPNYILSRNRTVGNIKKKLHYFNQGFLIDRSLCKEETVEIHNPPTQEEIESICTSINSVFGHLKWSNSYNLRQNLYHKHFGILKEYLQPEGNLDFFRPFKPPK